MRDIGSHRRGCAVFGLITVVAVLIASQWVFLSTPHQVTIDSGLNARQIGQILQQRGIIRSTMMFQAEVALCRCGGALHPGQYTFSGLVSIGSIISRLKSDSNAVRSISVTIPEGLRSDQIAQLLVSNGVLKNSDEFLELVRNPPVDLSTRFPWLDSKPLDQGLEGFLFGDTYLFLSGMRPLDVVGRLLAAFEQKIIEPLLTPLGKEARQRIYPMLILASIVEQEVRTSVDRAMVADVFQKRLRAGMPLQADSTVNYITGRKDTRARLEDVRIASPYNTYHIRGLPPSPISNPSVDAVTAVLTPRANPYYYFLTDPQGVVYYAMTLEQHKRNRAQYLTP